MAHISTLFGALLMGMTHFYLRFCRPSAPLFRDHCHLTLSCWLFDFFSPDFKSFQGASAMHKLLNNAMKEK